MSEHSRSDPDYLTSDERAELESLARSTKTEQRRRQRGAHRFAGGGRGGDAGDRPRGRLHDRHGVEMAGALCQGSPGRLPRRVARGAKPKYGTETDRRILALLDAPPPAGYGNWSGPLARQRRSATSTSNISGASCARRRSTFPGASLVREQRSGICGQGGRDRRALHGAARERDRAGRRRKALDPGARTRPRLSQAAERPGADRPVARLQAPRNDDAVRRPRRRQRRRSSAATTGAAAASSSSTS